MKSELAIRTLTEALIEIIELSKSIKENSWEIGTQAIHSIAYWALDSLRNETTSTF